NKFLCNGTGAANNSPSNPSWRTQEDDINPNRQIWKVRIDVNTGRYSIISLHDGRYINEIGNFGVNPYSADWNTYTITRLNGKYAMQCGGNAGTKFLDANSSRINRGDRADYNVKNFIFEFIPVNDEPEPTTEVTLPATVMILNDSGKALTKVGSQAKFTELSGEPKKTQQFTIEADKTSNRFAISCVSLGAPLDEKATFRTKADFSADWHTYIILEHNGKHSIQNCVHVNNNNNTNYWIATSDDLLSTSDSIDPFAAYQFTLRPVEESSISEIESSANSQTIYDLQGRRVVNPTKGLYIINGKVTRK
ncbi:MAG: hypothetical protein K2M09_04200, partial [Muribaculaceae bacterium]|nr:hypothetical protein [Muribaculaceae bacterium]